MLELLTGDALFGKPVAFYGELSLLSKIAITCVFVLGAALLMMAAVSLISHIMTSIPFVATPKRLTRKIVSLAEIQPGERVYDLGCGDGRFLIESNFYQELMIFKV